jgi:hypothetical protein
LRSPENKGACAERESFPRRIHQDDGRRGGVFRERGLREAEGAICVFVVAVLLLLLRLSGLGEKGVVFRRNLDTLQAAIGEADLHEGFFAGDEFTGGDIPASTKVRMKKRCRAFAGIAFILPYLLHGFAGIFQSAFYIDFAQFSQGFDNFLALKCFNEEPSFYARRA